MLNIVRYLRHRSFLSDLFIWKQLGIFYQKIIYLLPFNFVIRQKITNNYHFFLHSRFAFSDFKNWGNKQNNFFLLYLELAKNVKCFFDVGAHVGIVTLPVSKAIGQMGTVYSFEPSKKNQFFLNYHIKKNYIQNVKVINKVVSSKKKNRIKFFESDQPSGMNSILQIKEKKITNEIFCETITLDDFCIKNKLLPEIIKVDIEGAEIDLLYGSLNLIKRCQPMIFLSYHPSHIKKLGYKKDLIFKILDKINYKIYDKNFNHPLKLENCEYLLFPKNANIDKIKKLNKNLSDG